MKIPQVTLPALCLSAVVRCCEKAINEHTWMGDFNARCKQAWEVLPKAFLVRSHYFPFLPAPVCGRTSPFRLILPPRACRK